MSEKSIYTISHTANHECPKLAVCETIKKPFIVHIIT